MLYILDIKAIVTESLNILPDGTMDPTKSEWCFGGTTYKVYYCTDLGEYHPDTHFTAELQLDGELWYAPDIDKSSTSFYRLLGDIYEADIEYRDYCLTRQQAN